MIPASKASVPWIKLCLYVESSGRRLYELAEMGPDRGIGDPIVSANKLQCFAPMQRVFAPARRLGGRRGFEAIDLSR